MNQISSKPKWYQIRKRLSSSSKLNRLELWSKQFTLPGFSGVPIFDVGQFIFKEVQQDDIVTRANSVAFSFFLSLFPFVIFLLPLVSLTPWAESYISQAEQSFGAVFPENAKSYFLGIISGIQTEGNYGLQSIGFVFATIFASSGMLTLMYGFDKSYSISFKSRSYFKKRLIALMLTFIFTLILAIAIGLVILGRNVADSLEQEHGMNEFGSFLFTGFNWFIIIFLFYSVITTIYRYGPSLYKPLKLFNPGATVASFFCLVASLGFTSFINNFGSYNEIYGSIGALIVILLWFQINAFIMLAGFELNASIIVNRDAQILRSEHPDDKSSLHNFLRNLTE